MTAKEITERVLFVRNSWKSTPKSTKNSAVTANQALYMLKNPEKSEVNTSANRIVGSDPITSVKKVIKTQNEVATNHGKVNTNTKNSLNIFFQSNGFFLGSNDTSRC